jgi:sec-independent protein translocase protein TatB
MFGLGFGEILIILVLALVLLGPQRLPDAAKQLGKAMRDFQRATADVKHQFDAALYEVDKAVKPAFAPPPTAASPEATPSVVPPGGVPAAADVPAATPQNVPGLEAALAEPSPTPAVLRPRAVEEVAAPAPEAAPRA